MNSIVAPLVAPTNEDDWPEGAWIERCELRLQLPGKDLQTYHFGQYDPLPLNLSHVVRIAEELEKKVPVVKERDDLPANYEPRPGDVLKHAGDGNRFRVVSFTSDNKGVELEGIDQPVEMYITKDKAAYNKVRLSPIKALKEALK